MSNWTKTEMSSGAFFQKRGSSAKIIFYKKGWFRGKTNKYVVSRLALGTRKNNSFSTKADAMKFIRRIMKS